MTAPAARTERAPAGGDWLDRLGDTTAHYGPLSRGFHWILAYLLVWQSLMFTGWRVLSGDWMRAVARLGPSHTVVGVMVLILVVPRAIWALTNRRRRPPAAPGLPGRLARAGHATLYALMIVIPALGLVRAYASGKGFALWGLSLIPATGRKIEALAAPADLLHGALGWAFAVLIAGHIFIALVHQFVHRDGTIGRMLGKARAAAMRAEP